MNRLLAFGFLVSLVIAFTGASLLVIEEGTPGENSNDWRQLTIELPPAFFDLDGGVNFEKPIWTRRERNMTMVFPVLGSLECDETVDMSVAALIDGTWQCLDINSPLLPPVNDTKRRRDLDTRASEGKVDPPSCTFDEAPLVWNVSRQMWHCVDPDRALIQYVRNPPRPHCNDTDLVVYNEQQDWFECKALNTIEFKSTISKSDYRWQVPSTVRHIGSIASSTRVRSGGFMNFRWSNYAFTASTELIAYDQTSPPQVVTTGGANWLAYTVQLSFVGISGSSPYYKTVFSPIYPGTTTAYNNNVTKTAPGTIVRGDTLTFSPGVVTFAPSGVNTVTAVGSSFKFNSTSSSTGGFLIMPLEDVVVDAGSYPVVEIAESVSNWYVGTTPDFNPNLILTLAMWLQYEEPSGF